MQICCMSTFQKLETLNTESFLLHTAVFHEIRGIEASKSRGSLDAGLPHPAPPSALDLSHVVTSNYDTHLLYLTQTTATGKFKETISFDWKLRTLLVSSSAPNCQLSKHGCVRYRPREGIPKGRYLQIRIRAPRQALPMAK